MRALFIVNPRSGPRRRDRMPIEDRLRAAARETSLEAEIALTRARGDARSLAREAAAAGLPLVVAVGGDGTANEVVQGLAHGDTALGVLPMGSGNGFARDFGMSLDPARACRQLAAGRDLRIDLGQAGDRVFLMSAGFALDARVIHRFEREAAGRRGMLPYIALTLGEVARYRPPRLVLRTASERIEAEPWLLSVANTRQLGGGATLAPRARPDDGLLDFVVLPRLGLARALVYGARLFSERFDRGSRVRMLRAAAATLEGHGPIEAQLDGEAASFDREVAIRCLPGALRLRAPA